MPGDFRLFTNEIESGNAERAGADLTGYDIVDWPLSYDDLEPYYERFEWEFGISGEAGANPFAGPRKRGFPLPPLRHSARMEFFAEACRKLGYHPYETAAGILSRPYRPTEPFDSRIPERPACVYCGHCNFYGCHVHAKAATLYTTIPVALETGNFDLRTRSKVFRINTDGDERVKGVSYFDPEGQVRHLRARVVILSAFVFEHVRLLLLSKTGRGRFANGLANSSGYVGRNIMAHGDVRAMGAFDDYIINGFIGPGSAAMRIDDFNGNNFDHTGLGFIRGGTIGTSGDGTPVARFDVLPPDVRSWGKEFKDFYTRYYTRTMDLNMQPETLPHRDNRVDLDPHHRDRWGVPLPRVRTSGACKNFWQTSERELCAPLARAKCGPKKKGGPIVGRAAQGWAPIQKTQWSTSFARAMMCPISSSSDLRCCPRWPVIRRPRRSQRSPIERRSIF